ncbi:MAG: hypothetical protein GXX84_10760 [Acidobacteria bacterium]|nr:hypothetical protein [Acidobacteriota bacterium]
MSTIRVECYAGYRGDQYPLRFILGQQVLEVEEVEDQWYGPTSQFFRVRAADGNIYILRHDQERDIWTLEAFRGKQVSD